MVIGLRTKGGTDAYHFYGLEIVANFDRVPPKIAGGTGGPVRIIAIVP